MSVKDNYREENGYLITENIWGRVDRFKIIDSIQGHIWNIGRLNFPFPGGLVGLAGRLFPAN